MDFLCSLPLLQAAAEFAQIDPGLAATAAQALLGSPSYDGHVPSAQSHLNCNGSPLQVLVSLRQARTAVRVLGDPGPDMADPIARYATCRSALRTTLDFAGAPALRSAAERTLELVAPPAPDALAGYHPGSVFLAAALGAPGAALYLSPDTRGIARWDKARAWIAATSSAPDSAAKLATSLAEGNFLVGFGIEGALPGSLRIKLYWRTARMRSFADFGVSLFRDPGMTGFIERMLARCASAEALAFSAAFDLESGELRDVKVDVSRHDRSQDIELALLDDQAAALGMLHCPSEPIRRHGLGIACIGMGIDTAGERRLNTYLFQP